MTETWQLIDDIRALVAREGWREDYRAISEIEIKIAEVTCVGRAFEEQNPYEFGDDCFFVDSYVVKLTSQDSGPHGWLDTVSRWTRDFRSAAPFLRSRDAAALLEEAVRAHPHTTHLLVSLGEIRPGGSLGVVTRFNSLSIPEVARFFNHMHEAAARTLGALEAGHKLGIWPKEVAQTHG